MHVVHVKKYCRSLICVVGYSLRKALFECATVDKGKEEAWNQLLGGQ